MKVPTTEISSISETAFDGVLPNAQDTSDLLVGY